MGTMSCSALLLASVLAVSDVSDYEQSYCVDPDAIEGWHGILERNLGGRDADVIVRLYALRMGLCAMLQVGLITLEEANEVFDPEHIRGLEEVNQRNAEALERQQQEGLRLPDGLL